MFCREPEVRIDLLDKTKFVSKCLICLEIVYPNHMKHNLLTIFFLHCQWFHGPLQRCTSVKSTKQDFKYSIKSNTNALEYIFIHLSIHLWNLSNQKSVPYLLLSDNCVCGIGSVLRVLIIFRHALNRQRRRLYAPARTCVVPMHRYTPYSVYACVSCLTKRCQFVHSAVTVSGAVSLSFVRRFLHNVQLLSKRTIRLL